MIRNAFSKRSQNRYRYTVVFFIVLCFAAFINLLTGADGFNLADFNKFFHDESFEIIIYEIRLPRVLAAILAGALLGLSGAVMQGSLKNPLASPFTLGISQAAAFGASFAIIILQVYADETTISSSIGVGLCAF